ncbi:hypothetical protein E3P89_01023 [Wallemia ichthyophaga]|uniref:Uncharacterized protein n=1 Tax=Wallemia ichthyophaga TaxID=245174 RepID=A0A4T0ICQ2_WALIC|nr:hypothetical protein E3P90_01318 [Wallemia ichthyophaga]TIB16186.1 hypothetical protein E3P93_01069 [Wallemia ichthyophaga]TIB24435.1 hypothetical protein E3P89_01023 [Wallemia ichthyophaga]TIB26137.1 hypothetical protein E3P88_01187 [Wallemia ichthyophaga]
MSSYFPRPFNGKDYIPPQHLTPDDGNAGDNRDDKDNGDDAVTFKRYISNLKLGETWDMLALKYGNIDAAEDDEVDILTGELISDRGHIRGLDSNLVFGGVDGGDATDDSGASDEDSEHERELLEQHQALIHQQRSQRDQEDLDAFLRADRELHADHEPYYRDRKSRGLPTVIDFSESDAEWHDLSGSDDKENAGVRKGMRMGGSRAGQSTTSKRRRSSVQRNMAQNTIGNTSPSSDGSVVRGATKHIKTIELSSSESEDEDGSDEGLPHDRLSAWHSYSSSNESDSDSDNDQNSAAVKKNEYRTANDDNGDTSFDAFWKYKEEKYAMDGRSDEEELTDDSAKQRALREKRKRDRRMRPRDRRSMTLSSSSSGSSSSNSNPSESDKDIGKTLTSRSSHKGKGKPRPKQKVNFNLASRASESSESSESSEDDELTRRVKAIKLRQESEEQLFKKPQSKQHQQLSAPMSARKSRNVTPPRRTTIIDGMRTAPAKSRKETQPLPLTPTGSGMSKNRGTYTPSASRMQMTPSQRNDNRRRRIEETLADERKTRSLLSGDRSGLTPMMKKIMISDTPRSSKTHHTQTPSKAGRR